MSNRAATIIWTTLLVFFSYTKGIKLSFWDKLTWLISLITGGIGVQFFEYRKRTKQVPTLQSSCRVALVCNRISRRERSERGFYFTNSGMLLFQLFNDCIVKKFWVKWMFSIEEVGVRQRSQMLLFLDFL